MTERITTRYMNPFLAAILSAVLATIALCTLAALGISAAHGCGADYGSIMVPIVPLWLFSVNAFAGLASLLWLPVATLPGWFWGKRAVLIEAGIAVFALLALAVYGFVVPHPGDGTIHCAIIDRMF